MTLRVVATLLLASSMFARADVVHLHNGQQIKGRVTDYSKLSFVVVAEDGKNVTSQQSAVERIEFDSAAGLGMVATRGKGNVVGKLTRYENDAFVIESSGGHTETIPIVLVERFVPGEISSADSPTAGAEIELEKLLVPGKVTLVLFCGDLGVPGAQCRLLTTSLETL